jgi:hypothetical protein
MFGFLEEFVCYNDFRTLPKGAAERMQTAPDKPGKRLSGLHFLKNSLITGWGQNLLNCSALP